MDNYVIKPGWYSRLGRIFYSLSKNFRPFLPLFCVDMQYFALYCSLLRLITNKSSLLVVLLIITYFLAKKPSKFSYTGIISKFVNEKQKLRQCRRRVNCTQDVDDLMVQTPDELLSDLLDTRAVDYKGTVRYSLSFNFLQFDIAAIRYS